MAFSPGGLIAAGLYEDAARGCGELPLTSDVGSDGHGFHCHRFVQG